MKKEVRLTKTQLSVLNSVGSFKKNPTAAQVAKKLKKPNSTVWMALLSLVEKKFIQKLKDKSYKVK